MEVDIQEVAAKYARRAALGRIVVNPPSVTGPLEQRNTGSFFMCCNRAYLTEESYKKHREEKAEHGKPLDFSKFPRRPLPLQPERRAIHDPSTREFWMNRKIGTPSKVFEADDDSSEQDGSGSVNNQNEEEEGMPMVMAVNEDHSGNGRKRLKLKKCTICNLSMTNYHRHMKKCHTNGDFRCHYCSCTFNSASGRAHHQRIIHPSKGKLPKHRKQITVARAKKQLVSSSLRKEMETKWKTSKIAQCPVCDKILGHLSTAREHLNMHTGAKPHKCDVCGRAFNYFSEYRRHLKLHSQPLRSHDCRICKATFADLEALRLHQKSTHSSLRNVSNSLSDERLIVKTGEDNVPLPDLELQCPQANPAGLYKCRICSKLLVSPQSWRGHMRIHQNLKPYKCGLCGISFRLLSTRACHVKTSHSNGPFKCPYCTCSFESSVSLQRHGSYYHNSSKSTQDVSSVLPVAKNAYVVHQNRKKVGPQTGSVAIDDVAGYRCNLCGSMVKLLADFNDHKLLHSTTDRKTCNLCLRKFTSVINVVEHKKRAHESGTFKCPFCCCRYYVTSPLFRHLTEAHGMLRNEWNFQDKCIKPEARRRIQISCYKESMANGPNEPPVDAASCNDEEKRDMKMTKGKMVKCDLCNAAVTDWSLKNHKKKCHFHKGKYRCSQCSCRFLDNLGLLHHRSRYHGHFGKWKKAKLAKAEAGSRNEHPSNLTPSNNLSQGNTKQIGTLSYMCTVCEETFQDRSSFTKHVEVHQTEKQKKFECDLCQMRFIHRSTVLSHKKRSHFHSGTIRCSKCSCKFLTPGGLTNHNKVHHGLVGLQRKKYLLVKSTKMIAGAKSVLKKTALMKSNTQAKSKGEALECDICHLKLFNLYNHKKVSHDHDGKYQCSKCPCKFLGAKGLLHHETRHHNRISRRKEKLAYTASTSDNIDGNRTTQTSKGTGQRVDMKLTAATVECDLCLLQIHAKTKISQHQQNCHFHDGPFQCSFCTCKFKSEIGLGRHKVKYHQQMRNVQKHLQQVRRTSTKTTASAIQRLLKKSSKAEGSTVKTAQKVLKKTLQKRIARVSTCDICGCNFTRKSALAKHLKVAHTNGQYKCKYCVSSFHHWSGLAKHTTWHETGRTINRKSDQKLQVVGTVSGNDTARDSSNKTQGDNSSIGSGRFNLNFLKIRGSPSNQRSVAKESTLRNSKAGSTAAVPKKSPLFPSRLPRSPVKYTLKCDQCGIKFSQKVNLDRHLKKAHVIGGISCSDCSCTFADTSVLGAHKRVYHSPQNPQCSDGVLKVRRSNSASKSLSRTPTKTEDILKPVVNGRVDTKEINELSTPQSREGRENVKSGEGTSNQDRSHVTTSSPARSLKIRTPVKSSAAVNPQPKSLPFECMWCMKSFSSQRVLGMHILSHTRPEACPEPECDARFRMKEEVAKHLITHHGNGQFKCYSCSCRFTTELGRNQHFARIHKRKTAPENGYVDFVIEHDQGDDYDYEDGEPFLQIDSTYSHNSEFGEDSVPIVQEIVNANYSDVAVMNESYEEEEHEYGVVSSSSYSPLQDDLSQVEVEQESDPVIQEIVYEDEEEVEDVSEVAYQQPHPTKSNHFARAPTPKKAKGFSPKSRPIKCGACNTTCYGPENLRLHLESHKEPVVENNTVSEAKEPVKENASGEKSESIKCDICTNGFPSVERLAHHKEVEHDESGLYRCARCPCTMKTETTLRYHFMKYHDMC